MNSTSKTKWPCRICLKYLSSKRSFDEHMNIHNESRPFSCDQCEYSAASQMTLRRHKLRNHIPRHSWGYQCPYCGEAYMEPASYQQHVLTRHFGRSATFGCPHNGCTFSTKSSKHFWEHVRKHIYVMSVRSPTKCFTLQPTFNISWYLIDDELGSGFGKEALVPVAHRVSVMPKNSSDITSIQETSKTYDKDFLKTPMNLETVQLRGLSQLRNQINCQVVVKSTNPNLSYNTIDKFNSFKESDKLIKVHEDDRLLIEKNSIFYNIESSFASPNSIDWIETEIVIDNASSNQLPNGLADVELD